jgi:hypothetical protein
MKYLDILLVRTPTNISVADNAWRCIRITFYVENMTDKSSAVAQFVEALRYKLEGRGFDSRCCH